MKERPGVVVRDWWALGSWCGVECFSMNEFGSEQGFVCGYWADSGGSRQLEPLT